MFKNFLVIMHMKSPIATIEPITLDSIILAGIFKEKMKDDYYVEKAVNVCPTIEEVDNLLSSILDKKHGVYCTSCGFGDNKEFIGSWVKRFDDRNDDLIKFTGKGKERLDVAAGKYKNYHIPLVLKSYEKIMFYVRGDLERVKQILEDNIFYIGKKSTQGYGQIKNYEFIKINNDLSILNDDKLMRHVPCEELARTDNIMQKPIIPPYWRTDEEMLCYVPCE